MISSSKALRVGLLLVALLALVAVAGFSSGSVAATNSGDSDPAVYIVQLEGSPLASYRGGVEGLAATNPGARGELKLDMSSPDTAAYLDYLQGQQDAFVDAAEQLLGRSLNVKYNYQVAFNGIAATMTPAEAALVGGMDGVTLVVRETIEMPLTDTGPTFIGAPGIWDGSSTGLPGTMGEGIIVGVIDTGINVNDDHPSFWEVGGDGYVHSNPLPDYVGVCAGGNTNPNLTCNDKMIGYRGYNGEVPGDSDGHGSHTASTAAGNFTDGIIDATIYIELPISGVAPHANIISYDACVASCPSAGLLAAVNDGTADGVDVFNYSISGGSNPYGDPVELAFLAARDAGVFVSASAGNNGPGPGTVAHVSPWLTTVGASTHTRTWTNSLVDMAGGSPPADMDGRAISAAYGPATIVYAGDFGDGGCMTPFPPGTWTDGEIVVCDRGTIARVDKGANVLAGGAGGMVLANPPANGESINADPHYLPAVHLGASDSTVLKAWIAANPVGSLTASITEGVYTQDPAIADIMADFSSRGPVGILPDLIKPDVTAPGVDIFAAYSDPIDFTFLAGTSMSSPHNAGAGALMTALHPDWTPAEIQSAIMSTAVVDGVLKEDGVTPATPFDMGAGRDNLHEAGRAGLVLDETLADYQAANPSLGGDVRTLNTPSMGDNNCAPACSWTRTFRNTMDYTVYYSATLDLPAAASGTVTPDLITIPSGGELDVTVEVDSSGVPVGAWAFGSLNVTPIASLNGAEGVTLPDQHFPIGFIPQSSGDDPDIDVDPGSVSGTQDTNTVTQHPVDINNVGGATLDWSIFEDASVGSPAGLWSDNFDSYPIGTLLHGVGGWKGWANDPNAAAYTTDAQARSAPASVDIVGPADLVHEYSGATSGQWVYTAWQYVPGDMTGLSYFILLNAYDDAGVTNNWSTQVSFDGTNGTVISEFEGAQLPLVTDQWVEFRVEINLDTDWQTIFYDGQILSQKSWTEGVSGGGALNIAAVDLFANGASSVYYDDMSLVQAAGTCDAPEDIPWASVSPDNGSTGGGATDTVTVEFDSTGLLPDTYTGSLCVESNDPDEPLVVVPLEMNVEAPTDVSLSAFGSAGSAWLLPAFVVVLAAAVLFTAVMARRRSNV
jgi:hypothetical protein